MKKKIVTILIISMLALSVVACGNSTSDTTLTDSSDTTTQEENVNALDLTGNWYLEYDSDLEVSATITENAITVSIILFGGGSEYTYWLGTYDAPTEDTNGYVWISEKIDGMIDDDTLAFDGDSLQFTYADGELSFTFSAEGEAEIITLYREGEDGNDSGGDNDLTYATSETTDKEVAPNVIYNNYGITITAGIYHHDQSQDYITLTYENDSNMDIEIQGFEFIANGVDVENSYYLFLSQEVSAGKTRNESIYDGIYFESNTLPEEVSVLETLTFTMEIRDMSDYEVIDQVTVDLTME